MEEKTSAEPAMETMDSCR